MTRLRQAARFAVVGGAATATHLGVGLLLAETLGLAPFWASECRLLGEEQTLFVRGCQDRS